MGEQGGIAFLPFLILIYNHPFILIDEQKDL